MPKGADWIPLRVQAEPNAAKKLKATIEGFPELVMEKYYFQILQQIVSTYVESARLAIETSKGLDTATPTGEARKARGGRGPGRADTGKMVANLKWKGRKEGNKYVFEIGWLDRVPGYSVFQEYGTSNGVRAMNSLPYILDGIRSELKLYEVGKGGARFRNASRFKPNDGD